MADTGVALVNCDGFTKSETTLSCHWCNTC